MSIIGKIIKFNYMRLLPKRAFLGGRKMERIKSQDQELTEGICGWLLAVKKLINFLFKIITLALMSLSLQNITENFLSGMQHQVALSPSLGYYSLILSWLLNSQFSIVFLFCLLCCLKCFTEWKLILSTLTFATLK